MKALGHCLSISIALLDPMMVLLQFVTQKPLKLLSKQDPHHHQQSHQHHHPPPARVCETR